MGQSTVVACFAEAQAEPVKVMRGLKQGCPLSPLLYMLYTASLERMLLEDGGGFSLAHSYGGTPVPWRLPGLVYADDVVLMADNVGDLQHFVSLSANHLSKLGLRFNAKESAVLVFAGTDTSAVVSLPEGGQIPWRDEYRYLGVQLSTSSHVLDIHEENIRQTSRKAANVLRKRSLWGCNRFLLVREMWKCVHVPCLSFANAVLTFQSGTRQWLERGQREVGRLALGCHGRCHRGHSWRRGVVVV
ncbi:uncharacterized protein LOC119377157 [Rhipicephalus sanguineus]|uniref:uncharacterized protein LOC119377157 n=1 Tax=Rhipicephalus sanguineus TaxID=34632 RepID=UPI0018959114|nr:uncharacterized protein LOC119377157 [Rhipicephalus sanguineus]